MLSKVIEATKIIELYNTFVKRVEELELANVGDAKPILDVCSLF
jgi:putative component of toxin-antitoxin plasmid stabilization module